MIKVPNKSSIKGAAIDIGSATVGGMLSKGVFNIVPAKMRAQYETELRAAFALVAGAGAAAVSGKSYKARALRMFLAGMSIVQILKTLPALASKLGINTPSNSDTAATKFAAGILGLSCPCDGVESQNRALVRMPSLNASAFDPRGQRLENFGVTRNTIVRKGAFV